MTKQEFLAMSLSKGLVLQSPYGFRPNGKESTGIFRLVYLTGDLYADIENKTFPEEFIPVCRPLSDLTKEIEHKGEKFVPMTKLLKMEGYEHFFENGHKGKNACVIDCWWINTEFDDKPKPYEKFCTWHLDRVSFEDALKLIEWHFDLADLISKGEAIDVNALEENPYK